MSQEGEWAQAHGGHTLGGPGMQGGQVVRDEQHPAGPRLTLEAAEERSFWALTCSVPGWLVHTRFFDSAEAAHAAFEEMKPALLALVARLPAGGPPAAGPARQDAGQLLAQFTARFP